MLSLDPKIVNEAIEQAKRRNEPSENILYILNSALGERMVTHGPFQGVIYSINKGAGPNRAQRRANKRRKSA